RAGARRARPRSLDPPEGGRTAARKKGGEALLAATVASGRRLIPEKSRAAIDATGLESRHASRHSYLRAGKAARMSGWPKLSTVTDCRTHLFLSAVVTPGPGHD